MIRYMIDWTSSMQQTFEYYKVDPGTWRDVSIINNVKSCTISRDSDTDTLGSASIEIDEPIGECYIRVYLIAIQNGVRYKYPLGTFLVQTEPSSFDGKVQTYSADAYTPLIELKEKMPDIGYSVLKGVNVMDTAYMLARDNVRAPIVKPSCDIALFDDFVADTDDTWISFLRDFISNAKYSFDLDEMGRILFSPNQDTASLRPVYTFDDGNSSILYPELTTDEDLYGIPNVVEVIYSNDNQYYYAKSVNDDSSSPTSTVNRGREIIYRETSPNIIGNPTNNQIEEYADLLLKELSSIECTISYVHAYCPVRVGDCVRLNYKRAGIENVKVKVISQSIKCEPGCPVTEKAVFTKRLWR